MTLYPKSIHLVFTMSIVGIIIFILSLLDVIHFNAARFKYPDVTIALYDRDWKGAPYVIREESTHLWYEKGEFSISNNHKRNIEDILYKYRNYFTIDLSTSDDSHLLKISNKSNEKTLFDPYYVICLEEQYATVDKIDDGVFTDEYLVTGNMLVEIHNLMQDTHIHDYEIRLKAELVVTGLHSQHYLESQVKEYYISRSLQLIHGYL